MINAFLLILIMIPCKDRIYYSDDLIWVWEYYKGTSESVSNYDAVSCFGREFDANLIDSTVYNVSCKTYFVPSCSWTKDATDSLLLIHEFYHFKLEEYITQCYLNTLMIIENETDFIEFSDYTFYTNMTDSLADHISLRYDELTDYGRNYNAQVNLQKQIDSALKNIVTLELLYIPHD